MSAEYGKQNGPAETGPLAGEGHADAAEGTPVAEGQSTEAQSTGHYEVYNPPTLFALWPNLAPAQREVVRALSLYLRMIHNYTGVADSDDTREFVPADERGVIRKLHETCVLKVQRAQPTVEDFLLRAWYTDPEVLTRGNGPRKRRLVWAPPNHPVEFTGPWDEPFGDAP